MKIDSVFVSRRTEEPEVVSPSEKKTQGYIPNFSYGINTSSTLGSELGTIESGNSYTATNPNSSAVGKYQFLWNTWKDSIKKQTGITTKEDFANNPQAQERYYSWYEQNHVLPEVAKLRAKGLGTTLSDKQLGKLVHYRGDKGASQYLSGKLVDKPESYNMSISKYIGKYAYGGNLNGPGPTRHMTVDELMKYGKMSQEQATNFYNKENNITNNKSKKTIVSLRKPEVNKTYVNPIDEGSNFTRNWIKGRVTTGIAGLQKGDELIVENIKSPLVKSSFQLNKEWHESPGVNETYGKDMVIGGYYDSKANRSVIATEGLNKHSIKSVAVHETTHSLQTNLNNKINDEFNKRIEVINNYNRTHKTRLSRLLDDQPNVPIDRDNPIENSYKLISNEVKRSNKANDAYLSRPEEIHARIMQLRESMGVKSNEIITPERLDKHYNTKGKEEQHYNELHKVLDHTGILNSLNKTVMNKKSTDSNIGYAMYGGIIPRYSYGGLLQQPKPTYQQWKAKLPSNLRNTDTTTYNLRGAFEGGLQPELNEDGSYHLGSRNPKTGELLKTPNHPTWNKLVEGEKQAGYEIYQKNGKNYSRPMRKLAYGGNLQRMDIGGFLNSNKAGVANVGSLVGTALQSDPDNAVTSTLGSTVSGAASGFGVAGPIGAAVGGGIGLITGLVNSAERKKQKAALLRDKQNQAQAVMNQYSQQNWNMNMDMPKLAQYAYGGNLYEAEKHEVVQGNDVQLEDGKQLASDIHLVGGKSHEQGGTYGIGGDRVFSHRIPLTKEIKEELKELGIYAKGSVAQMATKIGKLQGKMEEKLASKNPYAKATAQRMIGRYGQALDTLFDKQEESKVPMFAYGGPIPKKRSVPPTLLPSVSVRAKRFIAPIPTIENTLPKVGTNPQPLLPKAETLDPLATRTMKGDSGEEGTKPNYFGYASSAIADLAQRSTVSKIKTRPDVSLVGTPSYSYTDRSQGAKRDVAEQLATTVLPDRYKGEAFVASLKATGDINANENQRRDQYNQQYSDQAFRTNAINSSIINQANQTELNNSNVKTQLAGEVTQGTLGNLNMIQAEKEKKILDAKRMALLKDAYTFGRTKGLAKEVLDKYKGAFSYGN